MTVSPLSLEKDGKQYSVTVFSKAISTFLNEDIFSSKDNTDPPKPYSFYWKELTFNFPTTADGENRAKQ